MVPLGRAAELGRAIIAASQGEPFGPQPDWWHDFEKQYEALLKGNTRPTPSIPSDSGDESNDADSDPEFHRLVAVETGLGDTDAPQARV